MMNQCIYTSDAYYLLKRWQYLLNKIDIILAAERQYNHHFQCEFNKPQL